MTFCWMATVASIQSVTIYNIFTIEICTLIFCRVPIKSEYSIFYMTANVTFATSENIHSWSLPQPWPLTFWIVKIKWSLPQPWPLTFWIVKVKCNYANDPNERAQYFPFNGNSNTALSVTIYIFNSNEIQKYDLENKV